MFFSLVFLALTSLTTVDLLVNERGLVVKEALGGYYRPVSYYLSKGEPHELLSVHVITLAVFPTRCRINWNVSCNFRNAHVGLFGIVVNILGKCLCVVEIGVEVMS